MSEQKIIFISVLVVGLLAAVNCSLADGRIIYVDANAAGANDGSSWVNAYINLQDALADANSAEKLIEIRVAQGVYKPDQGMGFTRSSRATSFQLPNGVTLKGGYAGVGSPDPNERDIELYKTTLSGDLNDDDAKVYNAQDMLDDVTRAENSFHVLTAYDVDSNASLDGFTVTSGNAVGEQNEQLRGGGIYCSRSKLNVENCAFENNSCDRFGGAIFVRYNSELVVKFSKFYRNASYSGGALYHSRVDSVLMNCLFQENNATVGGAIYKSGGEMQLTNCIFSYNSSTNGGGIFNTLSGGVRINNSEFTGNYARNSGGGIFIRRGTTDQILVGCTFKYNYASLRGGGMYSETKCSPMIKNCLFAGNSSNKWGGALHFYDCNAVVTNCTIVDNYAEKGGALCFGREDEILPSDVTISNSIIWNNFYEIYNHDYSWMRMTYCCRETAYSRVPKGCFSEDPCFVMPGWDYHLKSQAGSYDADSESWVVDDVTSPCIDAGDPTVSVGDESEPNGGRINMGAYGGTAEASMSYHDK